MGGPSCTSLRLDNNSNKRTFVQKSFVDVESQNTCVVPFCWKADECTWLHDCSLCVCVAAVWRMCGERVVSMSRTATEGWCFLSSCQANWYKFVGPEPLLYSLLRCVCRICLGAKAFKCLLSRESHAECSIQSEESELVSCTKINTNWASHTNNLFSAG